MLLILKGHRELLVAIPGAGLIRQLSRFTVLASFAYAVLVGLFIDSLTSAGRQNLRTIAAVIVLIACALWPWWNGQLTNTAASISPGADIRLRTKEFPQAYYDVEHALSRIKFASHALYLPYGMTQSFKDDPIFKGPFKEAVDVFALFSPMPGALMPTDRPSPITDFMAHIRAAEDLVSATSMTPANFYVLRRNMESGLTYPLFRDEAHFFPEQSFARFWDSDTVVVYARKNLVPLIYSPSLRESAPSYVDGTGEGAADQSQRGSATVLINQNLHRKEAMDRFLSAPEFGGAVEYRKIHPAKYRIRLHGARGEVPLVFGETYSRGWRLYPRPYSPEPKAIFARSYTVDPNNVRYQAGVDETRQLHDQGLISTVGGGFISKRYLGAIQNDNLAADSATETWFSSHLPEGLHLRVNGYANGWLVDVADICANAVSCHPNRDGSFDVELIMEFWPQQLLYMGLALSAITLCATVFFVVISRRRQSRVRSQILRGVVSS